MKKILMLIALTVFMVPGLRAEDENAKAIKEEFNTANKELMKLRTAAMKELKDDEKLKEFNNKMKEINEQRKALEKEFDAYLAEKKPELADAQKKVDEVKAKMDELRKQAKPQKEGGKKKEKKDAEE